MTDDTIVDLSDLSARKIRQENPAVDEEFEALEADLDEVRDDRRDLERRLEDAEETIEDLEGEVEARDQLLSDVRDSKREEAIQRIEEANEAVLGDDIAVELSAFEDADIETLGAAAEMAETLAAKSEEKRISSSKEDLDGTGSGTGDLSQRYEELASEMGLAGQLEKAEDLNPEGWVLDNDGGAE